MSEAVTYSKVSSEMTSMMGQTTRVLDGKKEKGALTVVAEAGRGLTKGARRWHDPGNTRSEEKMDM